MSVYLSRLFPRSNSSFFLCNGKALQSQVLRLREEMFLVDAGLGRPRICMQDDLTRVPINRANTRFDNKVGFLNRAAAGESPVKKRILERLFIDLVAGESLVRQRAAARFNHLVGSSTDVVAGGEILLPPRRFRQNQAWVEMNKIWRTNTKVKGFIFNRVRGGFSVYTAGFLAFLPFPRRIRGRSNKRFIIESIDSKNMKIVVSPSNSGRRSRTTKSTLTQIPLLRTTKVESPVTESSLTQIPLLTAQAGPGDGVAAWRQRLNEEHKALIAYTSMNKANDWFRITAANPEGTRWAGKCWYIHNLTKYEFDLQLDIPLTYPATAPEIQLPQLDGKTHKMYGRWKIDLPVNFKPHWANNCLSMGLAPWLASEVPILVDSGMIKHKDNAP